MSKMSEGFTLKPILHQYLKKVKRAFKKELDQHTKHSGNLQLSKSSMDKREGDIHSRVDAEQSIKHFYDVIGLNIFKKIILFWWCYVTGRYVSHNAVRYVLIKGVKVPNLPILSRDLREAREVPLEVTQLRPWYVISRDEHYKLVTILNLIRVALELIKTRSEQGDDSIDALFTFIFDLNDMKEGVQNEIDRVVQAGIAEIPGFTSMGALDRSETMKTVPLSKILEFFMKKTTMGYEATAAQDPQLRQELLAAAAPPQPPPPAGVAGADAGVAAVAGQPEDFEFSLEGDSKLEAHMARILPDAKEFCTEAELKDCEAQGAAPTAAGARGAPKRRAPQKRSGGLFSCCTSPQGGGARRKKTRRKDTRRKDTRRKTVRRKTVRRKATRRKAVRRKATRRKKHYKTKVQRRKKHKTSRNARRNYTMLKR